MNIRFDVNHDFLNSAELQIFEVLLEQRFAFNDGWLDKPVLVKIKSVLRLIGLILSLLATATCLLALVLGQRWQSAMIGLELWVLIFFAFASFFYLLPRMERAIIRLMRKLSVKNCKKLSKKCLKDARKLAPYTAEYDIKGGSVSYYREIAGELKFVWIRKLKGVAIQTECATVVLRKWTSFVPKIILLHGDFSHTGQALLAQGIDCKRHATLSAKEGDADMSFAHHKLKREAR